MKNAVLYFLMVLGTHSTIVKAQLSVDLMIASEPTTEWVAGLPLILSVSLLNEDYLQANTDNYFAREEQSMLDSMKLSGEITDSLYEIFTKEIEIIDIDCDPIAITSSEILWLIKDSFGEWRPGQAEQIGLHSLDIEQDGDSCSSRVFFFGIDPEAVSNLLAGSTAIQIYVPTDSIFSDSIDLPVLEAEETLSAWQYACLADYWNWRKNYINAQEVADSCLSLNPNHIEGLLQKSIALKEQGRQEEAFEIIERALELADSEQNSEEPLTRLLDVYYELLFELYPIER